MAKTSKADAILTKVSGIDPAVDSECQRIADDFRVAQMVFDARQAAGLTQQELAEAIGTTQSVISKLEDAEYESHSLSMLRRVAQALGHHVEIRLVADDAQTAAASR